jgi:hypothetical protein
VTVIVTVRTARAGRQRDEIRRQEDREWDSERRCEDCEHDAERRRPDRARDDDLRRQTDEKWKQRQRAEQKQGEDDAQEQVTVEFLPGGPLSQSQQAVVTGDGPASASFLPARPSRLGSTTTAWCAGRASLGSRRASITQSHRPVH